MRQTNNSSPPFLWLLLCTASTGEETRFLPLSPHNSFYNQIHSTVASGSAACSGGLLHANMVSERLTSRLWSHVLVAWNWTHTHTHARSQKKNREMTQPFVHTHLKPESAKIDPSDPFTPVLAISPLLSHHLNPSRKRFSSLLSSVICGTGPTFGGAGVPGGVSRSTVTLSLRLGSTGPNPPLFGSFGWKFNGRNRAKLVENSNHGQDLKLNHTLKRSQIHHILFHIWRQWMKRMKRILKPKTKFWDTNTGLWKHFMPVFPSYILKRRTKE